MKTTTQNNKASNSALGYKEYAEPHVEQLLKHSARTQLESLLQAKLSTSQRQKLLVDSFSDAMSLVLSQTQVTHKELQNRFDLMYEHAIKSMALAQLSEELLTKQYISATGLIMSPINSQHTIKDVYRIKGYVKGIDKAFRAKLARKESITVLYPACGPFAPLLLPLLTYYKEQDIFNEKQIQVQFVDAHPGAIMVLEQLVDDLELSDFVDTITEQDATEYQPKGEIDILLLEAMQHGFTREGHLSIAKNLVKSLNLEGVMIPQSVSVKGMMVIGETEFNQQWKEAEYCHSDNLEQGALADRVELGELMQIDKSSLLQMQEIELENNVKVVAANKVTLPTGIANMSERILVVYTQINTFESEGVNQYDSGITHPRPDMDFYVDVQPRVQEDAHFIAASGETVQFYYQLSGLPGFVPVKVQE